MKKLVCEMCGSPEIVKQEGYFVCQNCSTKYTVEEAKKLMIEGVVDVTGSTVRVDNTLRLQNLYRIARRAKDENNAENACRYYSEILVEDPNSWEASFYLNYFQAMKTTVANMVSAITSLQRTNTSVLKLIKTNIKDPKLQKEVILEVVNRCIEISTLFYKSSVNQFNSFPKTGDPKNINYQNMLSRCFAAIHLLYNLGNNIEQEFSSYTELRKLAVQPWSRGVDLHIELIPELFDKQSNKSTVLSYVDKIKQYVPDYQTPNISTSLCVIATAIYGSYDCPQVWVLRRFRDFSLEPSFFGRILISSYYSIGPFLVTLVNQFVLLNIITRKLLDRFVSSLIRKGYKNTPYKDI